MREKKYGIPNMLVPVLSALVAIVMFVSVMGGMQLGRDIWIALVSPHWRSHRLKRIAANLTVAIAVVLVFAIFFPEVVGLNLHWGIGFLYPFFVFLGLGASYFERSR